MKIINDTKHILIGNKDKLKNTVVILNHDHYKYMWSLKKERNSYIRNVHYPDNYINKIKEYLQKGYTVIINVDSKYLTYIIAEETGERIYVI